MLKRLFAFGIGALLAAAALGAGNSFAGLPPKPPWPVPTFYDYFATGPDGQVFCIYDPSKCGGAPKGGFFVAADGRLNQPLGW